MPWCDTLCVWFDLCTISDLAAHTTILPPGPMFCFGYVPSLQRPLLIWLSHTYVLSLISRCVSVLNVLHLWLKSFSSCSLTHELTHDLHDHTPWALLNNWGWSVRQQQQKKGGQKEIGRGVRLSPSHHSLTMLSSLLFIPMVALFLQPRSQAFTAAALK